MKKKILMLTGLALLVHFGLVAQQNSLDTKQIKTAKINVQSANNSMDIVYVLKQGQRNPNAKYLYKDLSKGLKRARVKVKPTISFVDIDKASAELFDTYDVVIVVNEDSIAELQKNIESFATKHKDKENMIVVAFLPRGKSSLSKKTDIDVISSPSREDPAGRLVERVIAPRVVEIVQGQ